MVAPGAEERGELRVLDEEAEPVEARLARPGCDRPLEEVERPAEVAAGRSMAGRARREPDSLGRLEPCDRLVPYARFELLPAAPRRRSHATDRQEGRLGRAQLVVVQSGGGSQSREVGAGAEPGDRLEQRFGGRAAGHRATFPGAPGPSPSGVSPAWAPAVWRRDGWPGAGSSS